MSGDQRIGNRRHQLLSSTLLIISVPCVEKDSSHRSVGESQESYQENESERIRENVKTRKETGYNV